MPWRMRAALTIHHHARTFVWVMVVVGIVFWFSMGATILFAHQLFDGLPERRNISQVTHMARSSVFYDIKGRPAFTIYKEQRLEVPLSQMAPQLKKATLAIEDQRFYDHQGIDFIRMVGDVHERFPGRRIR